MRSIFESKAWVRATCTLTCLACFQLYGGASAQVDQAWEAELESPLRPKWVGQRVLPTSDGGYVVAGTGWELPYTQFNTGYRAIIMKVSENGDEEWSYSFPTHQHSNNELAPTHLDIAIDSLGAVIACTPAEIVGVPELVKIDAQGQLLWTADLQGSFAGIFGYRPAKVRVNAANEIFVGGTSYDFFQLDRMTLHKFSPGGTLQWSSSDPGQVFDFDFGPQGQILMAGSFSIAVLQHRPCLKSFDADGSLAWSRLFSAPGSHLHRTAATALGLDSSGNIYAIANGAPGFSLTKFDLSGTQLFSEDHVYGAGSTVSDLAVDANGETYVVGSDASSLGSGGWPIDWLPATKRFSAGGVLQWNRLFTQCTQGFGSKLERRGNKTLAMGSTHLLGATKRLLMAYADDGTLLWAEEFDSISRDYVIDFTGDERGDIALLSNHHKSGQFPNDEASMRLVKHIVGGVASSTYCDPAEANSTGWPAELVAAGSASAGENHLTLIGSGLPEDSFALFLNGTETKFIPFAGGSQGNLCLGGAIGRYRGVGEVRRVDNLGKVSLQLYLGNTPGPFGPTTILSGETRHFQVWFRDINPGVASNFSNGASVSFQ